MQITGTLQKQAWDDNVLPPVEKVRDGLWSIPVPIPITPLRYVLVYVFEIPGGVAIIDAGWDTPEAYNALVAGLRVAGYEMSDVKAILITHVHPDHFGLAGRVREESGAWIGVHPLEAETLRPRYVDMDDLIARNRQNLIVSGVPVDEAIELAGNAKQVRSFVTTAVPDRMIEDNERIDLPGLDLQAIWTPGHTPGHLCFGDATRGLIFTGDHVLPHISPNISVHPLNPPTALASYLDSLGKVAERIGDSVHEVMPAHEYRFSGIGERVSELKEHHAERLVEVTDHVRNAPGVTAWELAARLTWSRTWDQIRSTQRRAALGETQAHLELLAQRGVLLSVTDPIQRWSVR